MPRSMIYRLFFCSLTFLINPFCTHAESPVISIPLKKISLVSDQKSILSDNATVWVDPAIAPEPLVKPLKKQLMAQINTPISAEILEKIKTDIAHYLFHELHLLAAVVVPPQDISSGEVQVHIVKSKIDQIKLSGNRWTRNRWLLSQIHLKTGQPLDLKKVKNDLAWLNRNPFRRTDLLLLPGDTGGTTDLELITQERFPLRPYTGGDNTGTTYTSYTRWFAGFNAGNLWGWDHQLAYQFTTTSDPYIFIAHTGSYTLPFPWKHQLYTYGGWSRALGKTPDKLRNKCIDWQISPRYQMPVQPLFGRVLQEFTIGYDFKQISNRILSKSDTTEHAIADINQMMIGYSFDYKKPQLAISMTTEIFAAPAALTSHQTDKDYGKIRRFASDRYGYARLRFSYTQQMPLAFVFKASFVGQGTAWNLMPSEQLGIGGYNTVRGYEERAFNADTALLGSIEIDAPPTRLFDWRKKNSRKEALQFLAFVDYGWGQLYHADVNQDPTAWMLGIGPGLRYFNGEQLVFRADLGFPLHPAGLGRHGVHLHVGGSLSF